MTQIVFVRGDITEQQTDAIVNAANSSLLGGGGVDGAIHRRGGPDILAACRELRDSTYRDGLPAGSAVATTAGRLPASWVIHTVGPVWGGGASGEPDLLASCYVAVLACADEVGASSIAIPAISTGIYGYPSEPAAEIAVDTVRSTPTSVQVVRFVCFNAASTKAYERALAREP